MKFDEILVSIGEFGWYQKRVYFIMMLPALLCGAQVMSVVFTMAIPAYRCEIPGYGKDSYEIQGPVHAEIVDMSIPLGGDDSDGPYQECYVYTDVNVTALTHARSENVSGQLLVNVSSPDRGTRYCQKWVYDTSEFYSTMMTEFNAVCQDKILRSHVNMAGFAGGLFGSIFMGILADVLGRKVAIMASLVVQFGTALGVYLAPSFWVIIWIKPIAGIATHSLFAISATTGIELVGPSKRTFTGMMVEVMWTIGVLLILPVAYISRDWREIQLVLCLCTVPLFSLWWLIPESPRWLLEKKKYKETEKILEKICSSNKTKLPLGAVDSSTADEGPQAKVWGLFTHRVLVIRTCIVFFNWLAVNLLYYGLSLNVGNLGGSTYLNFFLGAVVEMLGYLFALFLLDRTGRRRLHCAGMFVGGLACLAVMLPVTLGDDGDQWAATALAMMGKFCASSSYGVLYIMSAELFPTVLRNSGIGFCSIFENVGGMISPYIADLGIIVGGPFAKCLPMIVFGVVSIMAGLLSLLLPETLNRKLPETIQDAIDFDKKERKPSINGYFHDPSTDTELRVPLATSKI